MKTREPTIELARLSEFGTGARVSMNADTAAMDDGWADIARQEL